MKAPIKSKENDKFNHEVIQLEVTNKSEEFKTVKMFKLPSDDQIEINSTKYGETLYSIIETLERKTPTCLLRIQKSKGDISQDDFLKSNIKMNDRVFEIKDYNSDGCQSFILDIPVRFELKDDDLFFTIPPKCAITYTFFFEQN